MEKSHEKGPESSGEKRPKDPRPVSEKLARGIGSTALNGKKK